MVHQRLRGKGIFVPVLGLQFLPMNAFGGTAVHGFLNFIRVGAALVDHQGIAFFFIQFEYFRAEFLTGTAGNAL
jgi:hypothetical protein